MSALSRLVPLAALLVLAGCVTSNVGERAGSPREAAQFNVQLGLEYMRQGRRELAFEKLNRALEQDPKLADAHTAIAYAHSVYGEPERAERHYKLALRYGDNNPDVQNTYGTFLCQQGRMQEAERQLIRAARSPAYGTPEVAWTNAGLCARRSGDVEKAERFLREALRVNDRHPDALWQLAQMSFAADNALQARAFLQRFHAVAPRSAAGQWLGYQIERTLGDDAAAAVFAARLRSDFADSEEAGRLQEAERGRGR